VSKLCCPVCWELLKILRNADSTDFHVDGRHATLFQVELPEWLPLEIVVKLTARFETMLLKQINTLVALHQQHAHHPSGQSGNSLSSDSDGEEDATDVHHYELDDTDYRKW